MRLSIRQYALALLAIEQGISSDEARGLGERFVLWLVRRGEKRKLGKIVMEAERIARDREGMVGVTITTAHIADAPTREMLVSQAERIFSGKKIETEFREDNRLIGGAKMRSDERIYDMSLSKGLKEFKKVLAK